MSVTWTVNAADQLQTIRDYLSQDDTDYAQALVGRIVARTQDLDGKPFFGAEVPEYCDHRVREIFEHPYRILYRPVGLDIHIIAVIHSARNMPRRPPK